MIRYSPSYHHWTPETMKRLEIVLPVKEYFKIFLAYYFQPASLNYECFSEHKMYRKECVKKLSSLEYRDDEITFVIRDTLSTIHHNIRSYFPHKSEKERSECLSAITRAVEKLHHEIYISRLVNEVSER